MKWDSSAFKAYEVSEVAGKNRFSGWVGFIRRAINGDMIILYI